MKFSTIGRRSGRYFIRNLCKIAGISIYDSVLHHQLQKDTALRENLFVFQRFCLLSQSASGETLELNLRVCRLIPN